VECIASAQRVSELVQELLSSTISRSSVDDPEACSAVLASGGPAVAVDCEGVRLGRFGRICVVQLATPCGRLFLLDALRPGLVAALAPLLESPVLTKVMHDCREDSAALYHQFGVELQAVFDTQAVQIVLQQSLGQSPRQASAAELLRTRLGVEEPPGVAEMKELMLRDAELWSRRPLSSMLVRYALHGVAHLLALRQALLADLQELGTAAARDAATASERALQYRLLNVEFPSAAAMAKIGTRLWAFLAAWTDTGIYFKLNAGRVGLAGTPSAMARFRDVQVGDAVLCCVSGVSQKGSYLYLDRYDPDWDFFDHQLRPAGSQELGAFGREHRHRPTVVALGAEPDPLLLRGLPAAEGPTGGAVLDAWEAGPEDLGLGEEGEERA